jgi:hypothetical protein
MSSPTNNLIATPLLMCSNCFNENLIDLDGRQAPPQPLVTSDARLLHDVCVYRTLCPQCSCLEVHYDPEDRLLRYFRDEYDLSDEIQSNLIVRAGQAIRKHDRLHNLVFQRLGNLGERGRYLEVASGQGHLTRAFHERYPGWECVGIDPSDEAPSTEDGATSNIRFIRDWFRTDYFKGTTFDVIVAHGLINRSPVLPELLRMRELSHKGTLLSLDFVLLEQSPFAPHIWDHPFMFLKPALDAYLAHAGFEIRAQDSCVSSIHYLCECVREPQHPQQLQVDLFKETKDRYQLLCKLWAKTAAAFRELCLSTPSRAVALYGAGLFNAILHNISPGFSAQCVLDEVKAGGTFFNMPVITLEEAAQNPDLHVAICARPDYVPNMLARLKEAGIKCTDIGPHAPDAGIVSDSNGCVSG